MTLKEKFEKVNNTVWLRNEAELVKVAENFAIEFAEWLGANNYKKYSNGWANLFTKAISEKELLEIFKKEKV